MKRLFASTALMVALTASALFSSAAPASAARSQEELQQIATKLAASLARMCPHTADGNAVAGYPACAAALEKTTDIPLAPGILWGGDQSTVRIKQKKLTHFRSEFWRATYLPMFAFTGKFTIVRDEKDKMDVIKMEAYFRNSLNPGDYPYPFWHSSATWNDFEIANVVNFYLDDKGRIPVATRSNDGSDGNRGQYAKVTPPVFVENQWTWTDASGQPQPRIMLFTARYQKANPVMARLDESYRAFAEKMRETSCIACHNPRNPGGMSRLALLQTPLHAANEIERVIKSIKGGTMPETEHGMPEEIDPKLRTAMLRTAEVFRDNLAAADAWETKQRATPAARPAAAPVAATPATAAPAAR